LSGHDPQGSAGFRTFLAALLCGLALAMVFFALAWFYDVGGVHSVLTVVALSAAAMLCGESGRRARRPSAFLLGAALGWGALAAGGAARLGLGPMLVGSPVVAAISLWLARALPRRREARARLLIRVPFILLTGAMAAAAVALVMGYLPATRSLAYALADLGACFALGALITAGLSRRVAGTGGAAVAVALAIMAIALVAAFSFFGYPALVISGSAAIQTSVYLLTPGRVFPFWLLAFFLGMPAGVLWCGRWAGSGSVAAQVVCWVSGGLAVLFGRWVYVGPYALAVALALLAVLLQWVADSRARVRGSVALRAVAVAGGVLGLVWLAAGDPHMEWGGLRTTLGSVLRRTGPSGERAPAGRPVEVEHTGAGWRVVLRDGDVRAEFLNGNLVAFSRPGGRDQASAIRACVALGLAYAPTDGTVGLLTPALNATRESLEVLAPGRQVREFSLVEHGGLDHSLIISGPGPLTASGDPLALLSREGLERVKARLADGGVLALWLPAGQMRLDDLRRVLATVADVFPRYDVFLFGREAVVVAGGQGELQYARTASVFGEKDGAAARMLAGAGFWEPMDLLVGYVGDQEDLSGFVQGAGPYSFRRPRRSPVLARDLGERLRPAAVAALGQCRLLGPERLTGRLQFESPAQKAAALRGFSAIYADRTQRALSALGQASALRRRELLEFLTGPLARLDLFAPEQTEPDVRVAVTLARLGMRETAATVLQRAIRDGKESFAVHFELAGILEAQAEKGEALKHYRRALEMEPDSLPARGRMAALLLSMGREAEAADALEKMAEQEPDDVTVLLQLGYLYARLKRYDDAAETAERVLRIDPNNADAQALLTLTREAPSAE